MKWIMVLYIYTTAGGALTTVPYENFAACERAAHVLYSQHGKYSGARYRVINCTNVSTGETKLIPRRK